MGDGVVSVDEFLSRKNAGNSDKDVDKLKFQAADTNSDGYLDISEIPAIVFPASHDGVLIISTQVTMRSRDTDNDGALTFEEFWKNFMGKAPEEVRRKDFARLDTSGDGKLNEDELKAWESGRVFAEKAVKPIIDAADKDSDKHVSAKEMEQAA